MPRIALVAALLVGAAPAPVPQPEPPRFDAIAFFSGRTEGVGRIKILFRAGEPIRAEGRGRMDADVLILDQIVAHGNRPPRPRQWRIRQVAPGRYAGTLTDAAGPVAGESVGDRLHLSFTGKGNYRVDQWLTLSGDGRSARNRLTARRFGITVAVLDETIRRID